MEGGFMLYKSFFIIFAVIAITFLPISSFSESKEAKLDNLFQLILQNPSNIDYSLDYANTAIELQDYEAAIPAFDSRPHPHQLRLMSNSPPPNIV